MKRKNGFTMMELIIVIAIIGIIVAVAVPKYIGITEQSRKTACEVSRHNIEHAVELKLAYGDNEFHDFLVGNYEDQSDAKELLEKLQLKEQGYCESGGKYEAIYIKNGEAYKLSIVCSVHGNYEDDSSEGGGSSGGDETGNENNGIIDQLVVGSWQQKKIDAANNSGGTSLEPGIYTDGNESYFVAQNSHLQHGEANMSLADFSVTPANNNKVVEVDLDAEPLTSADTTTLWGDTVWKADNLPVKGTLYKSGEDYYMCRIDSANKYTAIDITNVAHWLKVSK